MTFLGWRRERFIRRVLRRLARQRVAALLQPGNIWLVEQAIEVDDETSAALRTCFLRGWVEPISDSAIPTGDARNLIHNTAPLFDRAPVVYRLTDSGWSVIHDSHSWVVGTFVVSVAALVASIIGVMIVLSR